MLVLRFRLGWMLGLKPLPDTMLIPRKAGRCRIVEKKALVEVLHIRHGRRQPFKGM